MEYTKKELADLCGVSVQAIDKKLRKAGKLSECRKVANRLQIPATIAATIATDYGVSIRENVEEVAEVAEKVAEVAQLQQPKVAEVAETATSSDGSEKAVEALVSQLETLQKQLEVKDGQIADLSAALASAHEAVKAAQETAKAAQALHAAEKAEAMAIESADAEKSRWQRLKEAWRGGDAR